jgi:hypothetical protein
MKNFIFVVLIIFLFLSPALRLQAQSSTSANSSTASPNAFDTSGFPQWAKDLRRWDIITFGVYPFALFFTTTVADLVRWNNANGMNMSDRRYAPWPLKSAGAIEMTRGEYEKVLLQAAGVSAMIACTDLVIVLIKRNKERKRIESRPRSTAVIDIKPYGEPPEDPSSADASADTSGDAFEKDKKPESDKN